MDSLREILLGFEKEKLADIIIDLLGKFDEAEKNEFISKYIDAQLALDSIVKGDDFKYLKDVKEFCKACLKGEYYVEYQDYWDNYYENSFESSEWFEKFTKYFNIAVMYSRNRDYNIAFEIFELLFNCLKEADDDDEILGTEEAEAYLEINWLDIFAEYYLCMKNCITDKVKMIEKALGVWLKYGHECTDAIINNIEEIDLVEKIIRENIEKNEENWSLQHLYFELFKRFNERYNPQFNKVELAKSFLKYNVNFYNDIAKEYFEIGHWRDSANIINEALEKVREPQIKFELKVRLVDCCEKLNEFEKAFDTIYDLFREKPSYELYNRTRHFAKRINKLSTFINDTINFLRMETEYNCDAILIRVLSREGLIEKLVDFMKEYKGYSRYDYLKFISKALIYRVLHNQNVNLVNLSEYLSAIDSDQIQGIVDIEVVKENAGNRDYYLNSAINILKEMVEFHIDAAKRSRYEKAAYYCGVLKDILCILNREDEFLIYYTNLIRKNNRKSALKDEMKKKIEK